MCAISLDVSKAVNNDSVSVELMGKHDSDFVDWECTWSPSYRSVVCDSQLFDLTTMSPNDSQFPSTELCKP